MTVIKSNAKAGQAQSTTPSTYRPHMPSYLKTRFRVERDDRRCIRCQGCVEQCSFGAQYYDEAADWVTEVEDADTAMNLSLITGQAQIDPFAGYNVMAPGADRQIFYRWDNEVVNEYSDAYMDEIFVGAGESEQFRFYFTETGHLELGTVFYIWLLDPEWTDLETASEVWDGYYWNRQADVPSDGMVKLTIEVVD